MGINAKILSIQQEVNVEKTGFNERQEYYYFKADDVLNAVRKQLNAKGIVTRSRILRWEQENFYDTNGRGRPRTTAEVEVVYVDAESGEEFVTSALATGSDVGGDKGPRKLATQAKKISLLDTFLIGENSDRFDSDSDPEQPAVNMTEPVDPSAGLNDLTAKVGEMIRDESPVDGPMVNAVGTRLAAELGVSGDQKEWKRDVRVMAALVKALENGEAE